MKQIVAIACALTLTHASAHAQSTPVSEYGTPIAAEQAQALIQRGMELAATRGFKMAFAVVEPSGELVAFTRMDGVPYASIRLAQQKARTAARLRVSSAALEERVKNGRTVLLSSDEVIAIGGGVLIVIDNRIIGALGISGATADQDTEIAEATLGAALRARE
ncbi:GlcG/HbpS family heme-binding protein [Sphingomonas sp. FW199]|uniref:GlcG/HbpS family heme-binding protein n=1 Tax=Sphingomonas sp. FW199 TaxID=3400217 RepID=UPI003CF971DA